MTDMLSVLAQNEKEINRRVVWILWGLLVVGVGGLITANLAAGIKPDFGKYGLLAALYIGLTVGIPTLLVWRGWWPGAVKWFIALGNAAFMTGVSWIFQPTALDNVQLYWLFPTLLAALYFTPWLFVAGFVGGMVASVVPVAIFLPKMLGPELTNVVLYIIFGSIAYTMVSRARLMLTRAAAATAERQQSEQELMAAGAKAQLAAGQLHQAAGGLHRSAGAALGQLTQVMVPALDSLHKMASLQQGEIADAAGRLGEIKQAVEQIATGAEEQTRRTTSAATLMGAMDAAIGDVTRRVSSVADAAQQTAQATRSGQESVDATIAEMKEIHKAVSNLASVVQELGNRSGRIGEIVAAIGEISEQTNLLALNAAIEAARAGEHGRGFAVVAEEVRHLAERSQRSAGEIETLITGIRSGIEKAVSNMSTGVQRVQEGVERAGRAGEDLRDIRTLVGKTQAEAEGIGAQAQRLTQASQDLVGEIQQIVAIAEENTASTEEMTASATEAQSLFRKLSEAAATTLSGVGEVLKAGHTVRDAVSTVAAATSQLEATAAGLQEMPSRAR